LLVMTAKRFGVAGVIDKKGVLSGVVSDGDLRRNMQHELLELQAKEVMNPRPLTINAHALAQEALGLMNEKSVTSLFVTDESAKPVGIIHIHDCLRAGIR
ncbi:MAG: CBS domain-containing protein, partial [Alphaproteobacteria bacterium]|nr:CBS domain-containing protein [Alphaproteobacteria bacterium]